VLQNFPRRSFHRFLTVIIHLQEIFVTTTRDSYKYGLLEQVQYSLLSTIILSLLSD
jgi:hypothetical protein